MRSWIRVREGEEPNEFISEELPNTQRQPCFGVSLVLSSYQMVRVLIQHQYLSLLLSFMHIYTVAGTPFQLSTSILLVWTYASTTHHQWIWICMCMVYTICIQRSRDHPQCVCLQWSQCISTDRTSNWRKPQHLYSGYISFIMSPIPVHHEHIEPQSSEAQYAPVCI